MQGARVWCYVVTLAVFGLNEPLANGSERYIAFIMIAVIGYWQILPSKVVALLKFKLSG